MITIEMSKNRIIPCDGIDLKRLLDLNFVKSARTVILGWLGEMDGETTEEDWRIYPYPFRLDGKISSPSFKKVFKDSPDTIHTER